MSDAGDASALDATEARDGGDAACVVLSDDDAKLGKRTASAPAAAGPTERPRITTCRPFARPTGAADDPFPQTLAATGCFTPQDLRKAVADAIPYDVNAPLWSDAATKRRWMVLPEGGKIEIAADGDFTFPIGTILLKSFELEGKMIETRFFIRHDDGEWAGYTYAWDPAGANAAALVGPEGGSRRLGFETWFYPSRASCLSCHTQAAGRTLGLELGQLDRDFEAAGGARTNQLATFTRLGLFAVAPKSNGVRYARPSDAEETLGARARAYLHANCSHCHRPGGLAADANMNLPVFDLRWATPLPETGIVDAPAVRGAFGIPDARLVAPGESARSMLTARMKTTVSNVRMPAIGSTVVDEGGVEIVSAWIDAMPACR